MIRHSSLASALLIVGLLVLPVSVPAEAYTSTLQAPAMEAASRGTNSPKADVYADLYSGSSSVHELARVGSRVFPKPYVVIFLTIHTSDDEFFTTLSQAVSFARSKQNAAVYDARTGGLLFRHMAEPYAIRFAVLPGIAPKALSTTTFASLEDAIAVARSLPEAIVYDRLTGAMLWSNRDNYAVISASKATPFETYEAAYQNASTLQAASIEAVSSGTILWEASYRVLVNGTFVRSFATLADAKAFATENAMSQVIESSSGQDVWDNIPRYDVYQNGVLVKQFAYKQDALNFATGLKSVTVVQISTQTVIYSNVPQYEVEVGNQILKQFVDENSAIAYAKTVKGSVVISLGNNQVVWSSTGLFGVYRYLQLIRSFSSLSDAVAYAKTLNHVEVINTTTDQVEYSNYPNTVRSPYGDTFSVQNGMVVDDWGTTITVLAQAPSFMKPGDTYVTEDYSHWYQVLSTGAKYVGYWENPYQTLNLETQSLLTAQQINAFFASHAVADSVLQNSGPYFIEAQKTYGVSAQYLVAHAIIESAWGTSYFAENRNNLFGYRAYTSNPDAAAMFPSIEYDINFQAWFVRNAYLNPAGSFYNGPNLDGMNVDYATDHYWANSIARVMSEIVPFSTSISSQPLLGLQTSRQVFPYPSGAQGLAVANLPVYAAVYEEMTVPPPIAIIPRGTSFPVLGDAPGWDQVQLTGGQTGFVNWNDVSLQNMVEAVGVGYGGALNIRSSPDASTSANIVDKVPNSVYLVVLRSPGDGWDFVEDDAGKEGWVSTQFVQVIH